MKLGIWSSYYYNLPIRDVIKRFCENGIYSSELSTEHGAQLLEQDPDVKKTGRELGDFARQNGFEISQGHLKQNIKICSDENAIAELYRWIDLYEAIGIKNMVLHCDALAKSGLQREERIRKNVETLKLIAKYVENRDVYICLENMRPRVLQSAPLIDADADDLLRIIDLVGSERLGICLDTGHLNLTSRDQRAFILRSGKKLRALHIADNDGTSDQHLMPFAGGNIDFESVVSALWDVGYQGVFNLEIPGETGIPFEQRDEKLSYIKERFAHLVNL